ncbi:MAG: reverse transcriptase family protein, partial [Cyanobacteria bacterium P01_D01_bin.2]
MFQTAAISRRARGRRVVGPVCGGDVAILVRDGLNFSVIEESPLQPQDDTTEWCAVRVILSAPKRLISPTIDIFNIYRPPIRSSGGDERVNNFSLEAFPAGDPTLIMEDVNGHHPAWDVVCLDPDRVDRLIHGWSLRKNWRILNNGAATRASYGVETRLSAPDIAMAHQDLARRCTWSVGTDLGSDHLPQVVSVSVAGSRPRRIRKTRWALHKADWTGFTADCDEAVAGTVTPDLPVEGMATRLTNAILEASSCRIPRGARADPVPWALDPELASAVAERRTARIDIHRVPSRETTDRWKAAKRRAAEAEEEARRRSFRYFVTEELNRPAAIGCVTNIMRRMEGGARDVCPGQTVNGDCGRVAVEDRAKAEAFAREYSLVSKHTRHRRRDRATKTSLCAAWSRPCPCDSSCQPFSRDEMLDQIKKMRSRKAPDPDNVCTEHLRYLGPAAQDALLHLINCPWRTSVVSNAWRRATIIPILKAGKNPQDVSSFGPISLTSHIAKLAERMVGARLTHLLERDRTIPEEQVGFKRGRSAEENLGRLTQEFQDGFNLPRPRDRPSDGKTAARFVLVAYDFSRSYDKIDHRMLLLKMLCHLPKCMASWVFQFLRDRRACAEVNGVRSSGRIFRAGLPQGSVLAPTLFTLWAADLVEAVGPVPSTPVYMYADDTATLSTGCTVDLARERAQQAADTMA